MAATRFTLTNYESIAELAFDDGGMNLLSSGALDELAGRVEEARQLGPRVLIFRSARPSIFAAGADMQEMQHFDGFRAGDFAAHGQQVFAAIEQLPCVSIAAIDGDCFGGALDLALAFDLRLATSRSRFSHPGGRIGIVTGFGGTSRWRELIDRGRVGRLFLDNAALASSEAESIGLVSRIVADDSEVRRIAERCAMADPARVRMVKEISIRGAHLPYDALHRIAARVAEFHRVA